jgi:hypothetical protein
VELSTLVEELPSVVLVVVVVVLGVVDIVVELEGVVALLLAAPEFVVVVVDGHGAGWPWVAAGIALLVVVVALVPAGDVAGIGNVLVVDVVMVSAANAEPIERVEAMARVINIFFIIISFLL